MMFIKNLISVIIPVYNVEKYLGRCLDSVLANTYKNLEIICVNDGSTDHCLEVLNNYKNQDSRILIVDKPNGGLSSARNSGIKIATGEFIAFIDSDDWIHPLYFEYLLRTINEFSADMSVCNFTKATDNDTLKDANYAANLVSVTTPSSAAFDIQSYVWRRLFRHNSIANLFFDEHEKIEDADFLLRLLILRPNIRMAYLDIPLYAYYMRNGSLVSGLSPINFLTLAEKSASYLNMTGSREIQIILAESAIKRALFSRFAFRATGDKANIRRCNSVFKKSLPYRPTFKFIVLVLFPSLHRLLLLTLDNSMRHYEKRLKHNQ